MEYPLIQEFELTTKRPEGGTIDWVELLQRGDGKWQINIKVSWRPQRTCSVAKFSILEIKLYALAATALRHIVEKYHYSGAIIVRPKAGCLPKTLI
jgi:hypothetical protein